MEQYSFIIDNSEGELDVLRSIVCHFNNVINEVIINKTPRIIDIHIEFYDDILEKMLGNVYKNVYRPGGQLYVDLKDGRSFSNNELKRTYMNLLHRNVKDGSYIIPEYIMDKFIPIVLVEKGYGTILKVRFGYNGEDTPVVIPYILYSDHFRTECFTAGKHNISYISSVDNQFKPEAFNETFFFSNIIYNGNNYCDLLEYHYTHNVRNIQVNTININELVENNFYNTVNLLDHLMSIDFMSNSVATKVFDGSDYNFLNDCLKFDNGSEYENDVIYGPNKDHINIPAKGITDIVIDIDTLMDLPEHSVQFTRTVKLLDLKSEEDVFNLFYNRFKCINFREVIYSSDITSDFAYSILLGTSLNSVLELGENDSIIIDEDDIVVVPITTTDNKGYKKVSDKIKDLCSVNNYFNYRCLFSTELDEFSQKFSKYLFIIDKNTGKLKYTKHKGYYITNYKEIFLIGTDLIPYFKGKDLSKPKKKIREHLSSREINVIDSMISDKEKLDEVWK